MDVIFDTVNLIELAVFIFYNARNVLIEFCAMRFVNCGLAMFCAEDNLVEDLTIAAHRLKVILQFIATNYLSNRIIPE